MVERKIGQVYDGCQAEIKGGIKTIRIVFPEIAQSPITETCVEIALHFDRVQHVTGKQFKLCRSGELVAP